MPVGPILQEPDAVTRTVLDVNLMGVVHGTKAVAPGMAERGGGQIINVASAVGRVAAAGGATYTASKFAVVGFSEATRAELAPIGVDVCLVMPTVVRTDLAAGVPQARFVKPVLPEDVAEAIEATIRKSEARAMGAGLDAGDDPLRPDAAAAGHRPDRQGVQGRRAGGCRPGRAGGVRGEGAWLRQRSFRQRLRRTPARTRVRACSTPTRPSTASTRLRRPARQPRAARQGPVLRRDVHRDARGRGALPGAAPAGRRGAGDGALVQRRRPSRAPPTRRRTSAAWP